MAAPTSNKLLPIIAGIVGVAVLFVVSKVMIGNRPDVMKQPPKLIGDRDTSGETLRTMASNLQEIRLEMDEVVDKNKALQRENQRIKGGIDKEIREGVQTWLAEENTDERLTGIGRKVDDLLSQMEFFRQEQSDSLLEPGESLNDIPVGLGLLPEDEALTKDRIIWVEPLAGPELVGEGTLLVSATPPFPGPETSYSGPDVSPLKEPGFAPDTPTEIPVYTVPENSTLLGSTSMTALIGRIPIRGRVPDPFPFKLLVGIRNLASNGIDIPPGLNGMVVSGAAIGDWTLSCVRGSINSVTFTFDDGTVRTISADENGIGNVDFDSGLGWISDRRGIPCITGERISDAPKFLGLRFLGALVEGYAEAFADSQTTNVVSTSTGTATSVVTGNSQEFAAGEAVAEGVRDIRLWLAQRQQQSFDVVYVDTGVPVEIHITEALNIDYETLGRKVSYGDSNGHHNFNFMD